MTYLHSAGNLLFTTEVVTNYFKMQFCFASVAQALECPRPYSTLKKNPYSINIILYFEESMTVI